MQTLTRVLREQRLEDKVLAEAQLARLVEGTPQRRHHLVNRALKAGELIRLRRGRYVLAAPFRTHPAHPYALAQAFSPGAYVSFETALSHHGWIPEAVQVTACVTPGRKSSEFAHPLFGGFSFSPLPLQEGHFLEMVERLELNGQPALVARPLRAMMDLVCQRKQAWQGLGWLVDGLRIDVDHLRSVTNADIRTLQSTYKLALVQTFLKAFARELGND